jgi:hypothetical protein
VSTIEELLERKSSGSGLENREYGRRDPSSCQRGTLYSQKLALASPTSGGLSVGIVRSRIQTMKFVLLIVSKLHNVNDGLINECGAVCGMRIGKRNRSA